MDSIYFPEAQNINVFENNILKQNVSKKTKVYASFPNESDWKTKIFSGIIETTKDDYVVLSDPSNGNWYMIPIKYVDYIEFEEKINI